jgi:hypothetical protein
VPLGEGLGNIAFEVNDTYVFRFPKTHVNIVDLQRELMILPVVRTHSTVHVPQPDFVPPDRSYVGYGKMAGRILMNAAEHISASSCAAIGRQLGAFLSSIHGIRVAALDSSAVKHETLCLKDCLVSARGHHRLGDTAFTDPADDFGLLYRDLGPTVLEASLDAYALAHSSAKDQIRRRARFYGRWRVLENIAYGLEPQNSPYLSAAMRSLGWLFPERWTDDGSEV